MSDAAPRPAPAWSDPAWRAVVAAFAFNGFLFGAWAARVPAFKDRLAVDPGTLGLLLLGLAGGAILSFPLAGALSERWGAARLTRLLAWGYAPALVALAFAPGAASLGLLLFVFGAFHGAMDVAMNGWGARVEARMGRSAMPVFHAMFSLGAGLGAGSGYLAVQIGAAPDTHFAIVASLSAALALLTLSRPATDEPVPPRTAEAGPIVAIPSGPLVLVGLVAFAVSMGEGAMADWSAVFLRDAAGATNAQAALGYAVFSMFMVAIRLLGGPIVGRLGPVLATRASMASALAGLLIAVFGGTVAAVLTGFALIGIGYGVIMPLAFSRAASDPVIAPGPAIAGVATLGYGGMLLGPPAIGFVAEGTGMRLSFLLLAGLAVMAFLLAPRLAVDKPGR